MTKLIVYKYKTIKYNAISGNITVGLAGWHPGRYLSQVSSYH